MHASQIIDMQVDLLSRLEDNGFRGVVENQMGHGGGNGQALLERVTSHVKGAYAYRVAPDMTSLIIHAAKSLDNEDRIDASLAPTGCGIVRFDRPLPLRDVRGNMLKAHWLTWGPMTANEVTAFGSKTSHGTLVTMWNDSDDPDEVAAELINAVGGPTVARIVGRWHYTGLDFMRDGTSLGAEERDVSDRYAEQIAAEGSEASAYTNMERYVHALWLLLNQTITTVDEEHVRATSQKAAQRKNLPGRVSVIDLRRSEGAGRSAGESHVEWTRRWVVRGHWRWQPYGPGRTERRRIWIAPFVKGPDDAPFEVPDKVYDLRR